MCIRDSRKSNGNCAECEGYHSSEQLAAAEMSKIPVSYTHLDVYKRQVVAHNEGGANKDLAKFADQIIALCENWDR